MDSETTPGTPTHIAATLRIQLWADKELVAEIENPRLWASVLGQIIQTEQK
jgi:hypothetical protein